MPNIFLEACAYALPESKPAFRPLVISSAKFFSALSPRVPAQLDMVASKKTAMYPRDFAIYGLSPTFHLTQSAALVHFTADEFTKLVIKKCPLLQQVTLNSLLDAASSTVPAL